MPRPCDPSTLPKYPPIKEFDAKLREEEARRYFFFESFYIGDSHVILSYLIFALSATIAHCFGHPSGVCFNDNLFFPLIS